jgi:hypothetical protein
MHLVGGAVTAGAGAAVSGTFAVGLSQNRTTAEITGTDADRTSLDVSGQVTVDADSRTGIKSYAIGGAGSGGVGVAGAVIVISSPTRPRPKSNTPMAVRPATGSAG